jgi:hypothetical protein
MKTPRIDAFIPNKKQVPELKSSLDNMPAIEKPKPAVKPQSPIRPTQSVRAGSDTPRRKIKPRWPFDIYVDQIEDLRKLSMEERMQGGTGSMSAMVREAIDALIAKKRGR